MPQKITHYQLRKEPAVVARRARGGLKRLELNKGKFLVEVGGGRQHAFKVRPRAGTMLRAVVIMPDGEVYRVYSRSGQVFLKGKGLRYPGYPVEGNFADAAIQIWLAYRQIPKRLRGHNLGSIMLRVVEQLYRGEGRRLMSAKVGRESALNFFLKNGFEADPQDKYSVDFVRAYLEAGDKKENFLKEKGSDELKVEKQIKLKKWLERGKSPPLKDRHSILVVGRDGKEKWHYISKEALKSA